MSDVREQPEPPPEQEPESEDSDRFFVVVDGSAEEELPLPTASEGELEPVSALLTPVDALLDEEPAFDDASPDAEDEEPEPEDVEAPELRSEVGELDDEEPEFQSTADDEPEFQSEVAGLDEDEPVLLSTADSGELELLELHPDADEGESPFAPLEARPRAKTPPPKPSLAPLRHSRRRDEYFSGAQGYEGPGQTEPPRPSFDPHGHKPAGGLEAVDESALPAYVVEQIERRRHERERRRVDGEAARRALFRQVAIALAVAFAVGGQLHGWLTLLSGNALWLLPVDAALGAVAGVFLAQAPDTIRGQLLVGGAAALAMGIKFAWAISAGALDGIALLFTFVLSVGLMFGAVVGGGILGLSLEQQIVE